ncbi:hypothetical protein D3C77_530850 [compost metagenome]
MAGNRGVAPKEGNVQWLTFIEDLASLHAADLQNQGGRPDKDLLPPVEQLRADQDQAGVVTHVCEGGQVVRRYKAHSILWPVGHQSADEALNGRPCVVCRDDYVKWPCRNQPER